MTTSTRTASATTSKGTVISINVAATRGFETKEEVSYCDGDNVVINVGHKTDKTEITLSFAGMTLTGFITTRRPSPSTPLFYGYFVTGKAVYPFEKEVFTAIENCKNEAIAESETDESWINYITRENARMESEKSYEAHVSKMNKAMSF
jgi:hypothetical protein